MSENVRCEPPPELRGVDGWHWVQFADGRVVAIEWHPKTNAWWQGSSFTPAGSALNYNWRYLAPVSTPAEVDALRAEVMHASTECADAMAQVVALRAEVARITAANAWQPIATAPRDGRNVLVWGPWEGEISAGDGTPSQYVAARMGGAYYVCGTDQYYGEVAATHWRPLPPGPADG